jgi:hypothetical protein
VPRLAFFVGDVYSRGSSHYVPGNHFSFVVFQKYWQIANYLLAPYLPGEMLAESLYTSADTASNRQQ